MIGISVKGHPQRWWSKGNPTILTSGFRNYRPICPESPPPLRIIKPTQKNSNLNLSRGSRSSNPPGFWDAMILRADVFFSTKNASMEGKFRWHRGTSAFHEVRFRPASECLVGTKNLHRLYPFCDLKKGFRVEGCWTLKAWRWFENNQRYLIFIYFFLHMRDIMFEYI